MVRSAAWPQKGRGRIMNAARLKVYWPDCPDVAVAVGHATAQPLGTAGEVVLHELGPTLRVQELRPSR